jgi:hypothetical protein
VYFRPTQLARGPGLRHEYHHEGWGSINPFGYHRVGGLFGGPSGRACKPAVCRSGRPSSIDGSTGGVRTSPTSAAGDANATTINAGSTAKACGRCRAGKAGKQAEGRGGSDSGSHRGPIQASRNEYYATGHRCACPNDRARNGSACGARSAYSRPGGAVPLCYPSDVTAAMIDAYRRVAAR